MARKPDLIAMKRVFQNQRGFSAIFLRTIIFYGGLFLCGQKELCCFVVWLCFWELVKRGIIRRRLSHPRLRQRQRIRTRLRLWIRAFGKTSFMPAWLSSSRRMGTPALAMIKIKNLMPSLTGTIRQSSTTLAKQPLPIKLKIWPLRWRRKNLTKQCGPIYRATILLKISITKMVNQWQDCGWPAFWLHGYLQ